MPLSETELSFFYRLTPLLSTLIIVGLLLSLSHILLIARHKELGNEKLFPRQLVMLGLTLAGVVAIAFSLPVSESTRNQVIALIGLLVSGVLAFSSSTLFANLMAGIMLRVTKPFKTGDFISIGEYFGRVVERGLLDTEIQSESRELVALPNSYMIGHPVSVTRSSGTIISTTLSLGYDVHHTRVETLLLEAAVDCELEDGFVQVLELGDHAISYKVSGKLTDVKSLLTARSNLCRYVLDRLHENGVEIVSPNFMNQRRLPEGIKVMPTRAAPAIQEPMTAAEAVAFDKAEQAEQLEKQKSELNEHIQSLKERLKQTAEDNKKQLQEQIAAFEAQLAELNLPLEETDEEHITSKKPNQKKSHSAEK